MKESIPLTTTPKPRRYGGIIPIKEVKDRSSENDRTLVKDIEEDTEKKKNISCSWLGRHSIIKMSTLPRAFSPLNGIPLSIPWPAFLSRNKQTKCFSGMRTNPKYLKGGGKRILKLLASFWTSRTSPRPSTSGQYGTGTKQTEFTGTE